ncbi:hypothetical protein [Streptomyces sp. 2A115]|uniref:hypothetical protein n=1 Tax=Streptomyces sp. 2A115 TaxID=3457439 RepID=UPI003FD16D07
MICIGTACCFAARKLVTEFRVDYGNSIATGELTWDTVWASASSSSARPRNAEPTRTSGPDRVDIMVGTGQFFDLTTKDPVPSPGPTHASASWCSCCCG